MLEARRDESGLTLVECLVAVAILGICFVSLLGGLGTSIFVSDVHRKQATSETLLRTFAESVKTAGYVACATTASYGGSFTPTDPTYTASINAVGFWNPSTSAFDGTCATTAADPGLQRITLQVKSSDDRAVESVQIAKRKP